MPHTIWLSNICERDFVVDVDVNVDVDVDVDIIVVVVVVVAVVVMVSNSCIIMRALLNM